MEKVMFMSRNTEVLFNGIALFLLGLFPCSINFSYTLFLMPFFILKLFCEMNVYLPNLQEYFETLQDVFRCPNE